MSETAIRIVARLYECRETVQTLSGAKWREDLAPFIDMITRVAAGKGLSEFAVAQDMARDLVDAGKSPLWVLAALVELLEPTPEVAHGH